MDKVIAGLFVVAVFLAIAFGIYWLIWLLWCWVMPQIWATGPASIIAPGYWLFAACWFLVSIIGKSIFGGGSKKD